MKSHECIIGLVYDYEDTRLVSLNGLKQYIREDEVRCELNGYHHRKLEEYANNCAGFERFDYCPICGKKINWKEICNE